MRILALLIFLSLNFGLFGQIQLNDVNFDRIPFKKVRKFIHEQINNQVLTIYDLSPTVDRKVIPTEYCSQEIRYTVKEDLATVWDSYMQASPTELWNGKRVSFGLLFSKPAEEVVYRGGDCSQIDTGQVVFLNFRLLRGVYNLALAFEFINVDDDNKIIEFSYIKGNTSEGKQCLRFRSKAGGITEIIHTSYFRSHSKLRDKILYPYFHKRATNEFHRNMRRIIKNQA